MLDTLARIMLDTGALKFGRFRLKSGRVSDYYVDVKVASTMPEFLKEVAERISRMPLQYSRVAGLELGSVPLAVALSLKVGIPFIIIRKERKEYGTGGRFVGEFGRGERILVVEDVITTGGTTLSGIGALRDAGGVVEDVVVVVDREEGGRRILEKEGVKVHALLKASDLMRLKREGGYD